LKALLAEGGGVEATDHLTILACAWRRCRIVESGILTDLMLAL